MTTESIDRAVRVRVEAESRLEVKRTILREALIRYRRELMDDKERELLWNRVLKLRRELGL